MEIRSGLLEYGGRNTDVARVVAALIDGVVCAAIYLVVAALVGGGVEAAALATAWALFYFFACESLSGQTLGKRLMKLRVFRVDGSLPGMREAAIRNVLRLVDGLFLYAVGAIAMLRSGARRQRIGDLLAETLVLPQDAEPKAAEPRPEDGWVSVVEQPTASRPFEVGGPAEEANAPEASVPDEASAPAANVPEASAPEASVPAANVPEAEATTEEPTVPLASSVPVAPADRPAPIDSPAAADSPAPATPTETVAEPVAEEASPIGAAPVEPLEQTAQVEPPEPLDEPQQEGPSEQGEQPAPAQHTEHAEEPAQVTQVEYAEESAQVAQAEPAEEPAHSEHAEHAEETAHSASAESAQSPTAEATEATTSADDAGIKVRQTEVVSSPIELLMGDWQDRDTTLTQSEEERSASAGRDRQSAS
ncbi:RDD family protein [Thermoleophilum album]|uniref:Uncharacterized membrane protein YckC, RDD family n=1 Tax=Thermoleophilum album TaxID=29539 RepID=A0A1H6FMH0_THEAL|nr:RDD family protein [Thermoleophilum album]SEH12099.1 Uncharacterized membrane protein YckC, RDD family [Thermoleophilum album]